MLRTRLRTLWSPVTISLGLPKERLMLAVASISPRPLEHFITEMAGDDRFLLHAERVQRECTERMQHITELPDLVWNRHSCLLHMDP